MFRQQLKINYIHYDTTNPKKFNLIFKRNIESTYTKILLNYLQNISICSNIRLNWGGVLFKVLALQTSLAGFVFKIISIDCFLKSKINFLII
jgi:hypothetical protein